MKKTGFFIIVFFILSVKIVSAHPPAVIDLQYDSGQKVLTLEIKHVTSNPRKHYVRKIIVYKNDKEIGNYKFVMQSPPGFSKEVPADAEGGDILKVKVICRKKGFKVETLAVPFEKEE